MSGSVDNSAIIRVLVDTFAGMRMSSSFLDKLRSANPQCIYTKAAVQLLQKQFLVGGATHGRESEIRALRALRNVLKALDKNGNALVDEFDRVLPLCHYTRNPVRHLRNQLRILMAADQKTSNQLGVPQGSLAASPSKPNDGTVILWIMNQKNEKLRVKAKKEANIGNLKKLYVDRVGSSLGKDFHFWFDGKQLNDSDTLEKLEVVNSDVIDVFVNQPSGRPASTCQSDSSSDHYSSGGDDYD